MFGPFSPGHSLRVYRLQRRGVSLDLQRGLTQPHTPLWEAYLAFLTQQAMGQPTYVLFDPHDGEAFIQIRYRPHQAAADVAYLAPSLAENHRATNAWARLLDGACIEAAGRGIQRVFANLPESGGEVDVFHQAGFSLYAGEEVHRLTQPHRSEGGPLAPSQDPPALRTQRPEDWPAIQKLCVAITPQRVRQAEGGIAVAAGWGKNRRGFVLPTDSGGDVRDGDLSAALFVYAGGQAHWLRALVHPDAQQVTGDLVRWGLATLADQPAKPVYCSVRRYESGMQGALADAGFELYATRSLMVKQTMAWIKTPVQELVPSLKSSAEPVPPAYHINGEAGFQTSNNRLAAKRKA